MPNNNTNKSPIESEEEDRIISSLDAAKEMDDQTLVVKRVNSGLSSLDKLTQGFGAGDLVVLSGPTKNGKTTLAQTFTNNLAAQEINSLWFTYEMPVNQFLKKFPQLPLFYLPKKLTGSSLEWIEKKISEAKQKFQVEAVFIDHLHYLVPFSQTGNMSLLIGSVMRELKKMSLKHEVIIYIIAHIKMIDDDKKPSLSDIRDSSFVGQESDFVLMIWRLKSKEENEIFTDRSRVALYANRRTGETGYIDLKLNDGLFEEITK